MNLKAKIEEWEKTKKEIGKWPWGDENDDYDQAMQALKEAAEIMKDSKSDPDQERYYEHPEKEWLKRWGFEG